VFGAIYTMNSGFNFQVIKARYSVEPWPSENGINPTADDKILIVTVAIKNATPADQFFNNTEFQAVDDMEGIYTGNDYMLASKLGSGVGVTLKPGQGLGQNPAADEFAVGIKVPAKAHITKLILKDGRKLVKDEEVVRYFIADAATKARDGADGNQKNVIAPLPDYIRDPADKSGAVAIAIPIVKLGTIVPSSLANMSVDAVAFSSEMVDGKPPPDGKQFANVTLTVTNLYGRGITIFDTAGADTTITDSDGEKYKPTDAGQRKAKRDEPVPDTLKLQHGESYTYRYFFEVPKDVKLKTLTFGQTDGHKYQIDISGVKS
jgi:hypothetical protein